MNDDSRVIDKGWDALPAYGKAGDADDAVTVSISTTPGEWLVNTVDAVVVPMSMAELIEGLRNHKLTERSLVWRAGMQEWATVDRVPQLKLAARLPVSRAESPAPARPTNSTKPPPKPVRATPLPPALVASPSHPLPSRKATLPFGLQTPVATPSRPASSTPSSPRHAAPPPPSGDDSDVLAVYARPAATISFDLSPERPLRAKPSTPPVPPETLAPMTTDSAARRVLAPQRADLSVVAASQFRQAQRSSKRLVWLSSLGSAAAASLLTLWLSNGAPESARTAAAPPSQLPALPLVAANPAAPPLSVASSAAPVASVVAVAADAAPAAPKPKARKPRVAAAPRPRAAEAPPITTQDPGAEPNPYDVKLDDEARKSTPASKPAAPAHEADPADPEARASDAASTPGF